MTTTSSMAALWDLTLEDLRGGIDGESFETWLEPIAIDACEQGELTLTVPSVFHRNWVARNYVEKIEEAFERIARRAVSVRLVLDADDEDDGEAPSDERRDGAAFKTANRSEQSDHRLASLLTSLPLNPNYDFESFVVGESNRFAHAAAQAVAEPESSAYNPLFIYGGVGLGKTHLMHAIGQKLQGYGRHLTVLYVSSDAFMNAFIESIRRKDMAQFRNCFRTVDLLMIDDVQFFAGAEKSQIEFFHTFNSLFGSGKKIVISSDQLPAELIEIDERLRSRFESGLIVDIQPPDLETRAAILRRKAQSYHVHLKPEVEIYIAERIKTNVRKLEGALEKLSAHSLVSPDPITIETARNLLGHFFSGDEPLRISAEKIQIAVCKYFDINLHDLTGKSRIKKFVRPRQIAAYLTREMTELSYPEIARKFGGRDHTSIIYSHRKVAKQLRGDLNLKNLVDILRKLIKDETLPGEMIE